MAKKPAADDRKGFDPASHRVVLLHGPNTFIAAEHTALVRRRLEEHFAAVDSTTFDGLNAKPADVLDECRSLGLMQQHKLVIVDNADQLVKAENRPLIERYVQSPTDSATLVLRATRWNKGKLDDMIAAVGRLQECKDPDPDQARRWAAHRVAGRHAATIADDALDLLVERTGADLGRLDTELAKLAAAAAGPLDPSGKDPGRPPAITLAHVTELVGRAREEEAWELQSVVLSGKPAAAVAMVRDLLGPSRQPPVLVMWACTELCRKLYAAAVGLREGENEWALAKSLKLWGPAKDAILEAAARLGPTNARRALAACVDSDARQKSGLTDPERGIERLALRLAHLFAASAANAR